MNLTRHGSLDAIRWRLVCTSSYSLPDWLRAANLNIGSTFCNCRRKDLVTKQKKVSDGMPLILRILTCPLSPCLPKWVQCCSSRLDGAGRHPMHFSIVVLRCTTRFIGTVSSMQALNMSLSSHHRWERLRGFCENDRSVMSIGLTVIRAEKEQ
jgi:hypothetical protein